jgi:D-glycero-D-manno-heptose 1,7-bisphosphate phosphatase
VFLDRDGTLNRKARRGRYVTSPAELELIPGAAHAVAAMNGAGLRVVVVTNQRGIATGELSPARLDDIHRALEAELRTAGATLDGIFVCPHDRDSCDCRKPKTGLLEQARRVLPDVRFEASVVVGDDVSDVQMGRRAGARTILLEGEGELEPAAMGEADVICRDLVDAVEVVLGWADVSDRSRTGSSGRSRP